MTLAEYCKGIADAIRVKEGSTGAIPAPDHAARIMSLSSGGNVDTCTLTISWNTDGGDYNGYVVMTYDPMRGYGCSIGNGTGLGPVTISNVVCNSIIAATTARAEAPSVGGGVVSIPYTELPRSLYHASFLGSYMFIAPAAAGATGTIELISD